MILHILGLDTPVIFLPCAVLGDVYFKMTQFKVSQQTEIGGSDRDGNNLQRGKERKGNSLLTGLTCYFHNAVPIRNFNIIMIKSQTCNIRN